MVFVISASGSCLSFPVKRVKAGARGPGPAFFSYQTCQNLYSTVVYYSQTSYYCSAVSTLRLFVLFSFDSFRSFTFIDTSINFVFRVEDVLGTVHASFDIDLSNRSCDNRSERLLQTITVCMQLQHEERASWDKVQVTVGGFLLPPLVVHYYLPCP